MRWVRLADRYGLGVGYAAGLLLGTVALHARPAAVRARWLDWASTNLANAPDHPIGALVVSAFLTAGTVGWWVLLALVGLGTVGVAFGAWRGFVIVAAAHVLGTVFSEGILAYRVATGALPAAYRHIQDVGPSYVVVGALAAGIAYAPWPGRLACAAGFAVVAPSLFGGLFQLEVSAVGHVSAILVALAVGGGFVLARRTAVTRPVPDAR
ncbi:MAG: hypothetical protein AUG44_10610 [Actinobacteria bacterium 13_1_20CM_3_71_11]|nr:MAG: hypothetical protein AUG44_10610 [Actinobacteria bacterium 13_1_20CM_3_71_11]